MTNKIVKVTPRRLAFGQEPVTPIEALIVHQVIRRFCIRAQQRTDRATEAFMTRLMGYETDLPEAQRKQMFDAAARLRRDIEKALRSKQPYENPNIPDHQKGLVVRMATNAVLSRQHWDLERKNTENEMERIARSLPVWPWVEGVKGVAELGLAVIVAEAGDLSDYSGPAKLWKRFGMAVIDGERQGIVAKEITGKERAEAWEARGYNPSRRAEIFAFLDDTMFRHQWRGEKDDVPAHAIGPYGEVYAERKAWNLARGWVLARADRDARRFMSKRFLCDLWVAWKDARLANIRPASAA